MATLAPIKIPIAGIDQFSSKMAKAQKTVNKIAAGMKSAGTTMTASVTAPVLAAGAAIFKAGYGFDKFMNMVEAKSTVSTRSIDELRAKALELGSTTSFSHIQAAEAMNYLAQAGYNTGQTFDAILPVLNLAQATNIELGQSADWLSNIMGGMGWGAEKSGKAAAILAQTTAKANVNMEELSYTFADVGPVAKMYGAQLEDVAAATGFLGNIGIKGSKAGTALKTMFINLASQTPAATKALKQMGIQAADPVTGKMKDFKQVLLEMSQVLPKMKQRDAIVAMETIFGRYAIAGVAGMTDNLAQTNSQFSELVQTIGNVGDQDLTKMVETMRKGSVGAWDDTVSALQGMGQAIADSGLQQFIIDILKGFTVFFRTIAEKSPAVLKLGVIFAGVLAAVGPLLVVIGTALPIFTALAAKIAAAGGVMALISNPIGWVVLAVIGLTAAVIALWDTLKPLRVMLGDYMARALTILLPLWDSLKRLFVALWGVVKAVVSAWLPLVELMLGFSGEASLGGLEAVVGILTMVVDVVTKLVGWFTSLVNLVGSFTRAVANSLAPLKEVTKAVAGGIGGVFSGGAGWMGDKLGLTDNSSKMGLGGTPAGNSAGSTSMARAQSTDKGGKITVDFKNLPGGTVVRQEGAAADMRADNGQILATGF